MCMWMCLGRFLGGDPPFLEQFFGNPYEVSRQLGASRAQAQGFAALGRAGLEQLSAQMEGIRKAFGPDLMSRIAGDIGLQTLMGRALADQHFAVRLQKDGVAAAKVMLGGTKSAEQVAAIVQSPQFARLNGFSAERQALSHTSKQFYSASAFEAARAALRVVVKDILSEARA